MITLARGRTRITRSPPRAPLLRIMAVVIIIVVGVGGKLPIVVSSFPFAPWCPIPRRRWWRWWRLLLGAAVPFQVSRERNFRFQCHIHRAEAIIILRIQHISQHRGLQVLMKQLQDMFKSVVHATGRHNVDEIAAFAACLMKPGLFRHLSQQARAQLVEVCPETLIRLVRLFD